MEDDWLRLATEHASELIGLLDADRKIVHASPSVFRFLGEGPNSELTHIHPDDREPASAWHRGILAGKDARLTYRLRNEAGEWRWLEACGTCVPYDGRPHVLVSSRDVTDELEVQRALRENEARLAEAGRIAHLGYWDSDLVTRRVTCSDETWRILGLAPRSNANAGLFLERIHPDDVTIHTSAIERAKRGEEHYDVFLRMIHDDGEIRTVHSVGEIVRDTDGNALRVFGVMQDVTERIKADEERALIRTLLDHANDILEVIDPETGRFLDVNENACRALGYTREEYLQLSVVDVSSSAKQRGWASTCEESRRRTTRVLEGTHRRKDGTEFPVEVNVTVVRREREYLLAIVRDITERKRAAEELGQMEARFLQAQKMEAVGRLAGGVAHDFNNLLTVIQGNVDCLVRDVPPIATRKQLLEEIQIATERAAGLTQQLLAFCRKQVLAPRIVDVDALLRNLRLLLGRIIGSRVQVIYENQTTLPRVEVDPGQLEQAIINLAINARDAMPQGGQIKISTRITEDGCVAILVADTGEGMNEWTRARVFEPFFTTKGPGRGTGLGLAMVHGFVEQSGGRIDVRSQVGKGTTFEIRLPATEAAVEVAPPPSSKKRVEGTETVLVVDDEDAIRAFSKRVLSARGYTVLDARDGTDAVALAREYERSIDILITDMVMPGMSGADVAATLGRERPDMRVLLISGYHDNPMSNLAFLPKPFRPNELASKVRELLDAR